MSDRRSSVPRAFSEVLDSLASTRVRADVTLTETPAPSRIAPYAVAVNGEINSDEGGASGRFVVLHDPAAPEAWDGTLRVIALVKAQVEAEIGRDDLWARAAWTWLEDALAEVPHHRLGGTATRIVNESFGDPADTEDEVHVELRASWTLDDTGAGAHIAAWAELLASCAGVPPLPEGVRYLKGRGA